MSGPASPPGEVCPAAADCPAPPSTPAAPPSTPATAPPSAVAAPSAPAEPGLLVRGRRKPAGLTQRTLDGQAMRSVPGTMGDPMRAVLTLPGIARQPYGGGALAIRGARASAAAAFVDGLPMAGVFHLGFGPSCVAADMVERIDYLPGSFSARYGEATSGVVDLTLRSPSASRWTGAAQIDLAMAGADAAGPLTDDTTLAVGLRRSYMDTVLEQGMKIVDVGDPPNFVPVFSDFQARLEHTTLRGERLTATVLQSTDRWERLDGVPIDPADFTLEADRSQLRLSVALDAPVRRDLSLSVAVFGSQEHSHGMAESYFVNGLPPGDRDALRGGLRTEARLRLSGERALLLGLYAESRGEAVVLLPRPDFLAIGPGGAASATSEGRSEPVDGSGDSDTFMGLYDLAFASPYVEATLPAPGGLLVTPGLRAGVYSIGGATAFALDPRLTARQPLTERVAVKVGLGRYSQAPTFVYPAENPDLYPDSLGGEVESPTSAALVHVAPAYAWQTGLGVELRGDAATTLDLDAYLVRSYGPQHPWPRLAVNPNGEPYFRTLWRSGQRRSAGFELLLKRAATERSSGWISYAHSRTEVRPQRHAEWRTPDWETAHQLNFVWSLRLPSRVAVGMRTTLASGRPFDFGGGALVASRGTYGYVGSDRSEPPRLPLYREVDLRIEKTWPIGGAFDGEIGLYLELINAGNLQNVEGYEFDELYLGRRALRGVPIYPAFGLRAARL